MIVDIDAHHGNGTQAAFYDTDEVLFVSLHQFPLFPGTGNYGEIGEGRGEGFTRQHSPAPDAGRPARGRGRGFYHRPPGPAVSARGHHRFPAASISTAWTPPPR